jgi:hypothetical protein
MKLRHFGFVFGSLSAVVFAVACSSSSGDDSSATGNDAATGSDTSTGSDSSTGTDTGTSTGCTPLADGTYAIAYSGPDGGPSCPPANTTITIGAGDGGDAGGLPTGCTQSTDSTTCASTLACDSTTAGYETKVNVVVTPSSDGTSATGTYSVVTTEPDGGPFSSCTGVTFTYTKQ